MMRPPTPLSQEFVDVVRKLNPELEDLGDEIERTESIPDAAYKLLFDNGLLTMTLPREWGGSGLGVSEYAPVLQEVAKVHGTLRMIVHGQNVTWRMVDDFGTPEQRNHWMGIFSQGGQFTFGLTEPDNGTGRDITTWAERDGDDWVINGTKHLITWGSNAELVHLIAATDRDERGGAIATCFLLPKGTAGVTATPLPPTMGCKGANHDVMILDNVRLPADSVLGEVGQGLYLGLRGFLDISRLGIAISGLGLAHRALELATEFSQQRITFGKPIASRQAIKLMLAEMASEIFAADSAVAAAAARYDRGETITDEASMCKLLAIELVGSVTDRALRIHGGIGYTSAHKIERHYRDARALWFEEGTAEVQKMVIADAILDHGARW